MANNKKLYQFLTALKENNNREWFKEHKSEYDELRETWLSDIEHLIKIMSQYDESLLGLEVKDSVYRIYRDIRFSIDKSPYKTYFSAVIGRGGRKTNRGSFYLHMEPGNSGLYGGIWWPEAPILAKLRREVDGNIEEFLGIINNEEFTDKFQMASDTLKTMPKGYPKEHPYGEYIKMKEYVCQYKVPYDYFFERDWTETVARDFKSIKPLNDFLNYIFDADYDS